MNQKTQNLKVNIKIMVTKKVINKLFLLNIKNNNFNCPNTINNKYKYNANNPKTDRTHENNNIFILNLNNIF